MDSNILLYLVIGPERVFMYFQIYESVRDEPYAYEKNNIMTNISHLRAKIDRTGFCSSAVHRKCLGNRTLFQETVVLLSNIAKRAEAYKPKFYEYIDKI